MYFPLPITEPLSSVSSLEVHFDLLDLTELTDMSDQELAEVFADSDEENHNECLASKCHHANTGLLMNIAHPPCLCRCCPEVGKYTVTTHTALFRCKPTNRCWVLLSS